MRLGMRRRRARAARRAAAACARGRTGDRYPSEAAAPRRNPAPGRRTSRAWQRAASASAQSGRQAARRRRTSRRPRWRRPASGEDARLDEVGGGHEREVRVAHAGPGVADRRSWATAPPAARAELEHADAPFGDRVREPAAASSRQLDGRGGGGAAFVLVAALRREPREHREVGALRVREPGLPRQREPFRRLRRDPEAATEQPHQHVGEEHVGQLVDGARGPRERRRAPQQRRRPRLVADRLGAGRGPDDPARLVELVGVGDHVLHERQADRGLALVELAHADEQIGKEAALGVLAPRQLGRPVAGLDRAWRVARPSGRLARVEQHLERLARVDGATSAAPAMRMSQASRSAPQRSWISPRRCSTSARSRRSEISGSARSSSADARSGWPACQAQSPPREARPLDSASTLSSAARSNPAAAEAWPLRRRARSAASSSSAAIASSGLDRGGGQMPRPLVEAPVRRSRTSASARWAARRWPATGRGDRRSHEGMAHLDAPPAPTRGRRARRRERVGARGPPPRRRARPARAARCPPSRRARAPAAWPRAAGARGRGRRARRLRQRSVRGSGSRPASCASDSALGSSTSASGFPRPARGGIADRRCQRAAGAVGDQRRRRVGCEAPQRELGKPAAPRSGDPPTRAPRTASRCPRRRAAARRTAARRRRRCRATGRRRQAQHGRCSASSDSRVRQATEIRKRSSPGRSASPSAP